MNSGQRSNRFCPNFAVVAALGPTTDACSKAFFGCSKPVPAGATCPRNIPAPARVGDVCGNGRNKTCGSKSGDSSSANWTSAANWTGANHFWMAALLQLKKGRVCRQNQTRQRHEVDGGGRRPRCSSGKPTGLGQPGGSDTGREYSPTDFRSARRTRQTTATAIASRRRPGLRQRSVAPPLAGQGRPADLSPSQRQTQSFPERRSHAPALPQTLENRTHLRLAWQFQEAVGSL